MLSFLFLPLQAYSTKSCPTPPCYSDATKRTFDKKKCTIASDWTAVGEIQIKTHDFIGMPLNKDFIAFNFIPKMWEKSVSSAKKKIPFKVGWCKNQMFPYNNSNGLFRFYGTMYTTREGELEYRYLYIERL